MIKKLLVILVILILSLLLFLALVPIFAQEAKVGEKLWISEYIQGFKDHPAIKTNDNF